MNRLPRFARNDEQWIATAASRPRNDNINASRPRNDNINASRPRDDSKKENGFTLIEFIIVIILVSIIVVVSMRFLAAGFSSYATGSDITSAERQAQLGMARMTRDIRGTRSASDISTATASQFSFTDMSGAAISYTLSSANLQRNGATLASGIGSLTFAYYDKNGTATATVSAIRYVGITLTVTGDNANYSVNNVVYPDNLS